MKNEIRKRNGRPLRLLAQYIILAAGAAFIILARNVPFVAGWYAGTVYPAVAFFTGGFAALFPGISVYDVLLTLLIAGLGILIAGMAIRRVTVRRGGGIFLRGVFWLVILFYFCWGMNYFRPGFYERYGLEPAVSDPGAFENFAAGFIDEMNESYSREPFCSPARVFDEVKEGYDSPDVFSGLPVQLIRPPKPMLYGRIMAGMGIKGYIGVYFNEATVNGLLLPEQYPFTVAHELAHTVGVAGEAEANFYAFRVCSRSSCRPVRFSAYISVLPYLLGNARQLLSAERYEDLTGLIRPEVKAMYNRESCYWEKLYWPPAGKVQDGLYDWFLRSNRVEAGRKDYYGVIAYLMAVRERECVEE